MTEPIEIDGWTCRVVRGQRSAQNYTQEIGAWLLPDGRFKTEGLETDGSMVLVVIPPAVLTWLVAPLIDRGAQQQAGFDEWRERETPQIDTALCDLDPRVSTDDR